MARKIASATEGLPTRSNPEVMGEDIGELIQEALGAGIIGWGNDKVVTPFAKQLVPGMYGNGIQAKIADLGTTAGLTWMASEAAKFISRSVANKVRRGGMFLVVIKALSGLLPGYTGSAMWQLSGTESLKVTSNTKDTKALPSAQAGYNNVVAMGAYQATRSKTMGF